MRRANLRLAFGTLPLAIASTAIADASITNPTNGHAYVVASQWMTWQDGRTWAHSIGASMVAINDAPEQTWFYQNIYQPFGEAAGISMWLGASDELHEGPWVWDSGESFTFSNWAAGEPNNFTANGIDEDYAAMWYVNPSGQWNDYSSPTNNVFLTPLLGPVVAEIVPAPGATLGIALALAGAASRRHRHCVVQRRTYFGGPSTNFAPS